MITEITQEVLTYYLPFTHDVKGSRIYESYSQGLEQADMQLRKDLLGVGLYNELKKQFEDNGQNATDEALEDTDYRIGCTLEEIHKKIKEYICNQAAYLTLGHHNVMQSHLGGFTTATGQSEVVASQTRVDDLREECRATASAAMDMLVKMLNGNSSTAKLLQSSNAWLNRTSMFFWTNEDARAFVFLSAPGYMASGSGEIAAMLVNTDPLVRYAKEAREAHALVQKKISRAQVDALIEAMRSGNPTALQNEAISLIRTIYAQMMLKTQTHVIDVAHSLSQLYTLMEDNINDFSEYLNSTAYADRHSKAFENKKDKPGYWFV